MLLKLKTIVNERFKLFSSYTVNKYKALDQHPVLQLIVYSVIINLILEMLSRRSPLKGFGFIVSNPLMFLFNVLIVLLTLTISMFFRKKSFVILLTSTLWLALGITNFGLLGYRTTPLTATDFFILKSVMGIIHVYLNNIQIVLIGIVGIVVLVVLVYFWRKLPKTKARLKLPLITLAVTAVLMLIVSTISFKVNALSSNFGNIADAYHEYGFAYCFSTSLLDRGISKPDDYSEENIETVLETIESQPIDDPVDPPEVIAQPTNNVEPVKPNIIMVQLESFFDVNHLINFTFSENPIPNFTQMKEDYSSGFLTVPSIGAGTANTEFEILTGMNLEYFGAGEYPYKTILQTTTCESASYDLDEQGYHAHAIHNNTGTFYDRNVVFQKLGFDSYSSIEYMNDLQYNPLGWAKDTILTTEIIKAMNATTDPDFVYTISVQPHGKYPSKVVDENQRITVGVDPNKKQSEDEDLDGYYEENQTSSDVDSNVTDSEVEEVELDDNYKIGFEYYVNQIHETDAFIGELTKALSKFDEPTVVVFYGDHLPSMSFEDEDLNNHNKFQTEYVLWSNFEMEKVNRDLTAYQLYAYIMGRLGYDNGILTKLHQRSSDSPEYETELEMLQYDMLYGEQNVYEGVNPYIEKPLKMGILDIKITDVEEKGEALFIKGENFTSWSDVYINDERKETLFIDPNTLLVPYENFTEGNLYVAQVTDDNYVLSKSEVFVK